MKGKMPLLVQLQLPIVKQTGTVMIHHTASNGVRATRAL